MMNLAEIRKKAQLQRTAPGTDPVHGAGDVSAVAIPAEGQAVSAESAPEPAACAAEPCNAFPGAMRDVIELPDDEQTFDPRELILAGRLSAGPATIFSESAGLKTADDREGLDKYLCFRVADEEYGVSLMDVREIIKARPVTEVPRMPRFVAGVLSLRGMIISVFDLRLRLGFERAAPTGLERIVILRGPEGARGLLVDEVHQVIGLPSSSIEDAPQVLEGVGREFVRGIGRHGGRMLILLDLEKVLEVALI